ncbi:hypothetical protein D3C84_252340 [compost metagenome]
MLTKPGLFSAEQRSLDSHRRVQAGHQVREGNAYLLRAATGQIVALAGDAHHSTHTLNDEVVTRFCGARPGLAETRHRAIHQAWIERSEASVIQPVLGQGTGLVVLDQYVATGSQGPHHFLPLGAGDV